MSIVYEDADIVLTETTAHFDGMCWPRAGERAGQLSHRLRYGAPTRSDLLMAAEIICAYDALVWKTQQRRNHIAKKVQLAETLDAGARAAGKP